MEIAVLESLFDKAALSKRGSNAGFDTINQKQTGFCAVCFFLILVPEQKYKNNLKNRESHINK